MFHRVSFRLEKLFDIARRVPFLAMTIVEKSKPDSPWMFRTQPLQTIPTESLGDVEPEMAHPSSVAGTMSLNHSMNQLAQPPLPRPQPQPPQQQQQQQHRLQQIENLRQTLSLNGVVPIDPKKVVKSSTAPNLPTSDSFGEMFRVI